MVAGLTPNTQKPALKTAALQVIIKLPDDIIWQTALPLNNQICSTNDFLKKYKKH